VIPGIGCDQSKGERKIRGWESKRGVKKGLGYKKGRREEGSAKDARICRGKRAAFMKVGKNRKKNSRRGQLEVIFSPG